jgi:hypothetical protein
MKPGNDESLKFEAAEGESPCGRLNTTLRADRAEA